MGMRSTVWTVHAVWGLANTPSMRVAATSRPRLQSHSLLCSDRTYSRSKSTSKRLRSEEVGEHLMRHVPKPPHQICTVCHDNMWGIPKAGEVVHHILPKCRIDVAVPHHALH